MNNDDLELLSRYAHDGANDAFEVLFRRHGNLVHSTALRIVGSRSAAEDVSQAVFIELVRAAPRLKPDTVLPAWLHRVTRCKAADTLRRETSRLRREQRAFAPVHDVAQAPESEIEPMLDEALDTLPDMDRAVVLLRFFERKSHSEIGDALGISADAAQKRVSRAVEQLRGYFTKRGIATCAAGVTAVLTANTAKAAPPGLAANVCSAVKSAAVPTKILVPALMTTTQKVLVALCLAAAVGFTIHRMQTVPPSPSAKTPERPTHSSESGGNAEATAARGSVPSGKTGPKYLMKPRLDENGKRQLDQDPARVLSEHSKGDGERWSRADDNLLVMWAARDSAAALAWVNGGERAVVQADLLGAVAAGIFLSDGKDAMRRFLDEHQQDEELRPKDRGGLESYLFYHLGYEDTFESALEILLETKNGSLAGSMIEGIDGAQAQTSAIDYMEAKGIPVSFNYWALQDDIDKDPRFWADWASQRDSDLLAEIVDGWARHQPNEAKAWVEERIPQNHPHRAEIDERMRMREGEPE